MIDNFRINDVFIVITTLPNQTVSIPGGTVIINEQFSSASGNAASLTINGIHIMIPNPNPGTPPIADVVISRSHSGISCGTQ
jgi:hypothetical protein